LFSEEQRDGEIVRQIQTTSSSFMINDGKGNFILQALPYQAQYAPIKAIQTGDFNKDGKLDILLAGNFFDSLPEWGRFDANYGILLEGQGKGKFTVKLSKQTGFKTLGQVRNMALVKGGKSFYVVLAKNNDKAQVFKY
jgi:hypothetical protein